MDGLPQTPTSGNGRCIISNEISLKFNGITYNKTTPLWSQASGQDERINRVTKKAIQSAVNEGRNRKHDLDIFR